MLDIDTFKIYDICISINKVYTFYYLIHYISCEYNILVFM